MQTGVPRMRLSSAFQTALGMLATNATLARRAIAGEWSPASRPDLSESDLSCLERLLSAQGERVLALAEMMTARRKHRVVALLPVTTRIVDRRLDDWWTQYLGGTAVHGASSSIADAVAFAAWTLRRLEPLSGNSELVRYELCQSDVASRLLSRTTQTGTCDLTPELAEQRIRLSDCVRIEEFDRGVYDGITRFRETAELTCREVGTSVHLLFHEAREGRGGVAITRVSRAIGLLLRAATSTLRISEMLSAAAPAQRPSLRGALERLIDLRVLDAFV